MKVRVAVLSGERGSNMKALVERGRKEDSAYEVWRTHFDKPCPALDWAQEQGLRWNHREKMDAIEGEFMMPQDQYQLIDSLYYGTIPDNRVDLICLAGWMDIVPAWFCEEWRGRILNIHPSLLPALKGLNTHQRAIDEKHEYHGCSVHLVTDEIDGGEVVGQARTLVQPFDCAKSLGERVLALEHELYPRVVNDFAAKLLSGGNDWGIFEDLRRSVEKYREEGGRH